MLWKLLIAFVLMAVCVTIHAVGIMLPVRWFQRHLVTTSGLLPWTRRFIELAGWIILMHLLEIGVWGAFYVWEQAIPGVEDALYFSAVTYTTTGYGDIVLPGPWRLYAAVEALTGILMCGWSTGFFFAVMHRVYSDLRRIV
jgi:ion channel